MDTKRKLQPEEIETIHNIAKKLRALRKEKIKHKIVTSEEANKIETQSRDQKKRKRKENEDIPTKKRCLKNIDYKQSYQSSSHGMVSFSPEYIKYLKESYPNRSYFGVPKYKCQYCNAIFWFEERNKKHQKHNDNHITYSNCCKNGNIKIPAFRQPPDFLFTLLNDKENSMSKHFITRIRQYNSLFSFTSMGGNIDRKINEGEGPYVFRVNGQIHHQIGSLLPQTDMIPKFAQLYIFDTKNEIQNRIRALTNEETGDTDIDPYIVQELKKMLDKHNSLVKVFRHARDIFEKYKGIDISIRIIGANKDDAVQFQMPHTDELAMLIVGDLNLENYKRDIIVSNKTRGLQRISIFHPAYMPLQYPLLFPYGERGFQLGITYDGVQKSNNKRKKRNKLTMHEYFKYHMHFRPNQPNPYLCYGRLSKQAIVDARAMEDEDRLMFIAKNQSKLRAEYIQGIFDAIEKGLTEGNQIGKRVLLPSSHTGCRRYVL